MEQTLKQTNKQWYITRPDSGLCYGLWTLDTGRRLVIVIAVQCMQCSDLLQKCLCYEKRCQLWCRSVLCHKRMGLFLNVLLFHVYVRHIGLRRNLDFLHTFFNILSHCTSPLKVSCLLTLLLLRFFLQIFLPNTLNK